MQFSKAQSKAQQQINEFIIGEYDDALSYYMECCDKYPDRIKWHQLYNCKGCFCDIDRWTFLKSYDTIVAVFDHYHFRLFDVLRYVYGYTATSAQHIAKFRNWVRLTYCCSFDDIEEYRYYEVEK